MKQGRQEAVVTGRNKVLLAEGEPVSRRAIHLLLQSLGYDVRAYATGAALLADPLATEASAIIVDNDLPDMGGENVLAILRAQAWGGPAILVCSETAGERVASVSAAGFQDVIRRPIRDLKLIDMVNGLVRPRENSAAI